MLDWSRRQRVGFSAFVSIGSMLDVDWGDLINYFGNDPNTHSIVIYMESIGDARAFLSDLGAHYLAGLLAHAPGMTALCTTTVNGFGRFSAHAMAPQSVVWGRDNRGAMLRVIVLSGTGKVGAGLDNHQPSSR